MTYGELKVSFNAGFNTSHVIDDAINNARFCFGKSAMTMEVSEYDLRKIGEASVFYGEQIHENVALMCWDEAQRMNDEFDERPESPMSKRIAEANALGICVTHRIPLLNEFSCPVCDELVDKAMQAYQDAGEAAAHLHGAWA